MIRSLCFLLAFAVAFPRAAEAQSRRFVASGVVSTLGDTGTTIWQGTQLGDLVVLTVDVDTSVSGTTLQPGLRRYNNAITRTHISIGGVEETSFVPGFLNVSDDTDVPQFPELCEDSLFGSTLVDSDDTFSIQFGVTARPDSG